MNIDIFTATLIGSLKGALICASIGQDILLSVNLNYILLIVVTWSLLDVFYFFILSRNSPFDAKKTWVFILSPSIKLMLLLVFILVAPGLIFEAITH